MFQSILYWNAMHSNPHRVGQGNRSQGGLSPVQREQNPPASSASSSSPSTATVRASTALQTRTSTASTNRAGRSSPAGLRPRFAGTAMSQQTPARVRPERHRVSRPAYDIQQAGPTPAELQAAFTGHASQQAQATRAQQIALLRGPYRGIRGVLDMEKNPVLTQPGRRASALAFLGPDQSPDEGLRHLNAYVDHLTKATRDASDPVTQTRLNHCLDDVAHHLVKTGWFETGSVSQLAHLANKLRTHERNPAVSAAISWIATQVMSRPASQLRDSKEVSLLLNAFSKLPRERRTEPLAHLARAMDADPSLVSGLQPIGISTALNAFSTTPESRDCSRMGLQLAQRLVDRPDIVEAFDEQGVSNALNALAKWPHEPACQEAMRQLAARIPALCPTLNKQGLANSLHALSRLPNDPACRQAAEAIVRRLATDATPADTMNPEELAASLNALSKWPDDKSCKLVAERLFRRILASPPGQEPAVADRLDAQQVSNVLNAASKWPNDFTPVAARMVGRILAADGLSNDFNEQEVSNVLGALEKWPAQEQCKNAAGLLAQRVVAEAALRSSMNPQELTQSLHALSAWPADATCRKAALCLAAHIGSEDGLVARMEPQHLSLAANALTHWPSEPAARTLASSLLDRVRTDAALLADLNAHDVGNVLTAAGRWPDEPSHGEVAAMLAQRIIGEPDLLGALNKKEVVSSINGLTRWPESPDCTAAAERLAERLAQETNLGEGLSGHQVSALMNALARLPQNDSAKAVVTQFAGMLSRKPELASTFNPQDVSNVLGALAKWPDDAACADAASHLAERMTLHSQDLKDFTDQGLSNSLVALSKWPQNEKCAAAAHEIAMHVIDNAEALRDPARFEARTLATLANGFSRFPADPDCQRALQVVAESVGTAERPWREFNLVSLAQLANAIGRLSSQEGDSADDLKAVAQAKLYSLAGHLETHQDLIENASAKHIGMIFKALASVQLQKSMRPLAAVAMRRINTLCDQNSLRDENLESLGTLCMGLLPLARGADLARHRKAGLALFNKMQPIIDRKIEAHLQDGGALHVDDRSDTRRPALSLFQIFKSYAVVQGQWKTRYVAGQRQDVKARSEELGQWLDSSLKRTRDIIESDLQEMSWNLIAQIDFRDDVLNALDLRMQREGAALTAGHPPTKFDLAKQRDRMAGELRPLDAGVGDTQYRLIDMKGTQLRESPEPGSEAEYSLYASLTGNPLVEVRLPGALSPFMLARTINHDGEQWRFDLFGGSHLKVPSMRPENIMANSPKGYGRLPAIRYSDTLPGSDMMKLVAKLAPQREDWSRIQRGLLETVPRSHVVEGSMNVGWFKDVAGPDHPFKLKGPDGKPIALCPNDGCGFLKYETAMKIPAVKEMIEAWQAERAGTATAEQKKWLKSQEQTATYMPPQALQHYPRDAEAIDEARRLMKGKLSAISHTKHGKELPEPSGSSTSEAPLAPDDVNKLEHFRLLINGGYEGVKVRAVPSADDAVHLPKQKSRPHEDHGGDILLGKPPYDKENLLPIEEHRVATAKTDDATARMLSEGCFAIQYSYTAFDDRSKGSDPDMLQSKGMLIIPMPEYWPEEYQDLDMASSTEDMKAFSGWIAKRDRDALPATMPTTGSLRVKDLLLPGTLGAIPIPELRKRDMDTDGDDAYVFAGYPKLTELVKTTMTERNERKGAPRSFKPVKTAQTAYDKEQNYQPGRASNILDAQQGDALVGKASMAAVRFLAQPDDIRHKMAEDWMFGTYDGVERDLRNGLLDLVGAPPAQAQQKLPELLKQAEAAIGRAHHEQAIEAATLLRNAVAQWHNPAQQPAATDPVSEKLAARFPELAQAYAGATTPQARVEALLDHYPACRLSHALYPQGQPGFIPGEPELTMRNLFTLAVKTGTDALKSNTGTETFLSAIGLFERLERQYEDRIKVAPHGKQTARLLRDDKFDPDAALADLRRMPTMAAAVMETSIEEQQRYGLLARPVAPAARVAQQASPAQISAKAAKVLGHATRNEPAITGKLEPIVDRLGGSLVNMKHKLKSPVSLEQKLSRLIGVKQKSLDEAADQVNDALRYSITFDDGEFCSKYRSAIAELDNQGFQRVQVTNHFKKKDEPFNAVSVTFLKQPENQLLEMQFHTPSSFAFKEGNHDLYKKSHAMDMAGRDPARKSLMSKAVKDAREMDRPDGIDDIDDWRVDAPRVEKKTTSRHSQQAVAKASPEAQGVRKQAEQLEKELSPGIRNLAKEIGAGLHNEDHWLAEVLKSPKSIDEKIARLCKQGLDRKSAALQVRDGLRYTMTLQPEEYASGYERLVSELKARNMRIERVRNGFSEEPRIYAGINIKVSSPGGLPFEIQLHTKESLRTKLRAHRDYERLRRVGMSAEADTQAEGGAGLLVEDREQALRALQQRAQGVQVPDGAQQIKEVGRG